MTATRRPGRPWRPGRVLLGWAVAATAAMAAMVTAGSNCFVASRVTQERQERSIPPAAAKESEGEEMIFISRSPLVPNLFPSFNVTTESDVQNIAGAMQALADEGSGGCRIVDVKLLKAAARSKLLYLLAYLNKQDIRTTAQVLPRQRDGRMRLRVVWDYPVKEDPDPEVFRVGAGTNGTALSAAMSYRLRSVTSMHGSSRANTVRLELFGSKASDVAMAAVERTQCDTSREISLVVHFEETGSTDDRPVLVAGISAT